MTWAVILPWVWGTKVWRKKKNRILAGNYSVSSLCKEVESIVTSALGPEQRGGFLGNHKPDNRKHQ